jgi:hypothetical protein
MSLIGGILQGLNHQNSVQTHGSVEDLIRSTLGNRFNQNPEINESSKFPQLPPPQLKSADKNALEETLSSVNETINSIRKKVSPDKKKDEPKPIFEKEEVEESKEEREISPFEEYLLESKKNLLKEEDKPKKKNLKHTESVQKKSPSKIQPIKESDYYEDEPMPELIRRKREYIFHRDSDETFECKVTVEGGNPENTIARLVLKTDLWNLVFDGTVRRDGTCVVPLKKLSVFPDGTIGEARLEIIVDDVMFIPWESPFKVASAKKVSVQVMPSLNRR